MCLPGQGIDVRKPKSNRRGDGLSTGLRGQGYQHGMFLLRAVFASRHGHQARRARGQEILLQGTLQRQIVS